MNTGEDLRVPKIAVNVSVELHNREVWEGRLFLTTISERHHGPEQVMDLLQQRELYLPIQLKDGPFRMIQKATIVRLKVDRKLGLAELDPAGILETASILHRVKIRLVTGEDLLGDFPIWPDQSRDMRLLDWINAQPGFLPLLQPDAVVYIAHASVAWLEEEETKSV